VLGVSLHSLEEPAEPVEAGSHGPVQVPGTPPDDFVPLSGSRKRPLDRRLEKQEVLMGII
jgi:hypothetical protein